MYSIEEITELKEKDSGELIDIILDKEVEIDCLKGRIKILEEALKLY